MMSNPAIPTHRIARRWPYRILNHLSPTYQLKFLLWKAGGAETNALFDLRKGLETCRRILIATPESFLDLIIALPLLQAYQHKLEGRKIYLLADASHAPFLKAIFSPEQLIFFHSDEILWGEPTFTPLKNRLQGLGLDFALNLRRNSSPMIHFLLKTSLAPLRIDIFEPESWPFANIRILSAQPPNLLRTYLSASQLWNYAGIPLQVSSKALRPEKGALDKAVGQIRGMGLDPDKTALFLWQDVSTARQMEMLRRSLADRGGEGGYQSLVIVFADASVASLPPAPVPAEAAELAPTLRIENLGQFLALAASTQASIGAHGTLLHLAGLCNQPTRAFFLPTEAYYDTSFLRPNMQVEYIAQTVAQANG